VSSLSYKDLTKQQKADTEPWILTAADKRAVDAGMWWDLQSAAYNIWWIERFCKLYEGAGFAGKPLYIHGYADQPEPEYIYDFYEDLDYTLDVFRERFKDYYRHRDSGGHCGWQLNFQSRCYGWKMRSKRWEKHGIPTIRRFKSASVFVPKKSGKMLDVDTPIPTPDGWKRNGDLQVGDEVYDEDGKACRVTVAHPIEESPESYLVTFSNGEQVKACADHLWSVESLWARGSQRTGSYYKSVWSTKEMLDVGLMYGKAKAFRLTLHSGIETPETELQIDPYVLGMWLGDGSSDRFEVTSHWNDRACNISSDGDWGFFSKSNRDLREMDLRGNKRIPKEYLRASFGQRTALLQGLMDSDGYISEGGKGLVFTNTNSTLVDGFCELLASLGIKYSRKSKVTTWAHKGVRKHGVAENVRFSLFKDHVEAFRLPRKLGRQKKSASDLMLTSRSRTVHVTSIEPCDPVPMRCITVDSPSSTYLFGKTMLPTHNSPTMAANVVYITCGDGEPGNKVFIGAANQDQAGIAWKHSYQMIQQSVELKHEFKPNMSTKRVEHLPSKSTFEPMSSANTRSQEAKEGLNGSVCLDETHVLDSEFVSILEYAGVSRAEALQLEFSTAGKNPEAYGATRWKYGERVNEGEEDNLHHLHISYNAPQNLTPEELDRDPEKYIRLANPSLGHTVDMEELLPSYHAAKRSTYDLRKYMMYRLNIFQNAASSWLDPGAWAKCGGPTFKESFLRDRSCVIGLDLARRYDLAAAVLCWLGDPEEDSDRKVYVRPYFWCAEDIVQKRSVKIPEFLDWTAGGYIKATPGNVIDFRTIESDIRKLIETYDVRGITYDAAYAEDLIQRLIDGVTGPDGDFVYQPLAIGEKSVSQGMITMTGMTTDFENDVKSGRIVHEQHPVLSWQVGNAMIKEDNKGNIQVVKESRESVRTVDGVVAAIMGRWGLVDYDDFSVTSFDYYVHNDVEFV